MSIKYLGDSNIIQPASFAHNTSKISNLSNAIITPEHSSYFKKKVCYVYVDNPKKPGTCAGCMKTSEDGFHHPGHVNSQKKWTSEACTYLVETDNYGEINFPGSKIKTANFIRVANNTKACDMIQYLYSEEGCNLSIPKLILSVTGGAQNFTIPHRMKKAFKEGLIKAAASTGAWIITGGTNTGVMRLVGEAVAEEYPKYSSDIELTVLGIATWGKIAMRDKLFKNNENNYNQKRNVFECVAKAIVDHVIDPNPKFYYAKETCKSTDKPIKTSDVLLDPNHNNFIMVDDGSIGQFGKEIEFRANFEAELRKGKSLTYYKEKFREHNRMLRQSHSLKTNFSYRTADDEDVEHVPMVLIVVQGGPNTLLTVEESLRQNIPVLILADSKGCADLIANACGHSSTTDDSLKTLIEDSNMFAKLKGGEKEAKVSKAVKQLRFIVEKREENLINVFKLDSEEGSQTIELAILRAFLNSRKNQYYENLKLALHWNRVDIAKSDIFTGEEEFTDRQRTHLLEMALIHDKPEFVELMLETGIDLKSFLTKRRLYYLYNSQIVRDAERKCPLMQLFKRKYYVCKNNPIITFRGLNKFLRDYLFDDFKPNFLPHDSQLGDEKNLEDMMIKKFMCLSNKRETSDYINEQDEDHDFGTEKIEFPEKNLFVWCLLFNRIDMAKIFWKTGEFQIITALFASNLLKKMAERLSDLEDNLIEVANYFEDIACGVLNIFDENSDDLMNGVILLQKIPYYEDLHCLEMAIQGDCLRFIALSSVQTLITNIWNGQIESKNGFKAFVKLFFSICTFGFLAPFLVFEKRHSFINISESKEKQEELIKAKAHLYNNQK